MADNDSTPNPSQFARISRRALLGAAPGFALAGPAWAQARPAGYAAREAIKPFAGAHQQGIETLRQSSVVLTAFDVTRADRASLIAMLKSWSRAIEILAAGRDVGAADSDEAAGLSPARLTVTVGFGPSLFDGRFGLKADLPPGLQLPAGPRGESIDSARSGGDLIVQACSDDAVVSAHAVRQLRRLAGDRARLRWLESGYAPPDQVGGGPLGRNPLGFEDGTANPALGSPAFGSTVWVQSGEAPAWQVGGTALCYRRIRIDLAAWDRLTVPDQQVVIGRRKRDGAPLSGGGPDAPLRLAARTPSGALAIPIDSHVRLAAPASNRGATIFRRSFAYDDGAVGERFDTGLLFLAFAADPSSQFNPIFERVAASDRLNQFTTHTADGVWALPPAPQAGGWLGDSLLG